MSQFYIPIEQCKINKYLLMLEKVCKRSLFAVFSFALPDLESVHVVTLVFEPITDQIVPVLCSVVDVILETEPLDPVPLFVGFITVVNLVNFIRAGGRGLAWFVEHVDRLLLDFRDAL